MCLNKNHHRDVPHNKDIDKMIRIAQFRFSNSTLHKTAVNYIYY